MLFIKSKNKFYYIYIYNITLLHNIWVNITFLLYKILKCVII